MARVLIAGCGDVGIRLAARLVKDGHDVWGLRRNVSRLPAYIRSVAADLGNPASMQLPEPLQFVFYMPSAGGRSDDAYRSIYVDGARNLFDKLQQTGQRISRVYYVSSTGVYGQIDGEWVDEDTQTEPLGFSGRRLLEGESAAREAGYPCTVVRFAGIYGPGRNRMIQRVQSGCSCVSAPILYTNRIYSEDGASMLQFLMGLDQPQELYIGVDHEPAAQCEVMGWIAQRLGVATPKGISSEEPNRVVTANKRCSNQRILESGFQFRYPTFREGYAELLRVGGY